MKRKPKISIEEQLYRAGIWERPLILSFSIKCDGSSGFISRGGEKIADITDWKMEHVPVNISGGFLTKADTHMIRLFKKRMGIK